MESSTDRLSVLVRDRLQLLRQDLNLISLLVSRGEVDAGLVEVYASKFLAHSRELLTLSALEATEIDGRYRNVRMARILLRESGGTEAFPVQFSDPDEAQRMGEALRILGCEIAIDTNPCRLHVRPPALAMADRADGAPNGQTTKSVE